MGAIKYLKKGKEILNIILSKKVLNHKIYLSMSSKKDFM